MLLMDAFIDVSKIVTKLHLGPWLLIRRAKKPGLLQNLDLAKFQRCEAFVLTDANYRKNVSIGEGRHY